jgi:hypothetical protein
MHGRPALRMLPLGLVLGVLGLALLPGTSPLRAAEPPAVPPPAPPKATEAPMAPISPMAPVADPGLFARLLDSLFGEADEIVAAPPGETPAKPIRLSGAAAKAEPLFAKAMARREAGDAAGAKEALHQILALPHLDSRRALRAWKALRDAGEIPEGAAAGQILGVVVELDYEVEGEHAILAVAGYAEGDPVLAASSGYSLSGARLRSRTVSSGKHLVTVAQPFLADIPKEESSRLPGSGQLRFVLLTPGGIHAREAARRDLESDPAGLHPLYVAAQQLLVALRLESERLEDARKP